ncbi:hypothetical protein LRS06_15775 [Hymenobacter sp. J193]|uniref:hypothetical protein n=1 Tax=Hymenobacter sp. J193 TaxID=2898429 RepID=UPI002151BCB9|nr:hypothetical protein [Hymenobacter sp. J193]MCR5889197.1 hypothetical protein [Hymenobacter sp. J193]
MSVYRRKEKTIKRLAYYQIIGGVVGFGIAIWSMMMTESITGGTLLVLAIGLGFFSFSIYCGQQLLKGAIEKGLRLAMLNQALQVLSFTVVGFGLNYVAGLGFLLGVDFTEGSKVISLLTSSGFELHINSRAELNTLSINLVAIYLMRTIATIQKKAAQEAELAEYAARGKQIQ